MLHLSCSKIRFAGPYAVYVLVALCAALLAPAAGASGFPPVANNDTIVVVRGGTATELSDGSISILANDFDAENDNLFIILTRSPRRGTLTLNADGTFIYQHGGSSRNGDNFRYVLYDGTGFSNEARVQVQVIDGDPVAPTITGQNNVSVAEDSSLTISLADLIVSDPDSNYPQDFTLEVGDGANYSRSNLTITPARNFNGQLTVPVRVFDGSEFSNQFPLLVNVSPRNDRPFTTGAPPDQEAVEAELFSLSLSDFFSDVDANDTLRFTAAGLPISGNIAINAQNGVMSGVPVFADAREAPYGVTVTATDSGGASASLEFRLTIVAANRADMAVTGSVTNPVGVGEDLRWEIRAENLGPADLENGELVVEWSTSGQQLALSAPGDCVLSSNNSTAPSLRCIVDGMQAGAVLDVIVTGTQNAAGDNSMRAEIIADDPRIGNNVDLVGAQVVAAFSEGPTQSLGIAANSVGGGDFNGDGLVDFVVSDTETIVFFNAGNRSVSTPGLSLGESSGGNDVAVLDWNGDTFDDIAVAGNAGLAARVYLNAGDGTFMSVFEIAFPDSGNVAAIAAADFDGNGFDDLIIASSTGTRLVTSNGDGDPSVKALGTVAGIDALAADWSGDGSPDVVVVAEQSRDMYLLQNSGNGQDFTTRILQYGSISSVSAADVDNDGDMDLLLALDGSDFSIPESRVLRQDADGTFAPDAPIGASPLAKLLAGDINGDGLTDIVAVNIGGIHQLYRGNSDGSFSLEQEQIVSDGMRRGLLTDFNSDDSLDLILVGREANFVEVHANNGIGRLGLGDRVAPVIQLNGEASVTIAAGAVYVDPGITATDDIDGDLTDAVVTSGNVDTSVVGSYTIRYSVSDKAGNLAATSRAVNVGINEQQGGGGGGVSGVWMTLVLLALLTFRLARRRQESAYCNLGPFSNASRVN